MAGINVDSGTAIAKGESHQAALQLETLSGGDRQASSHPRNVV